MRLAGFVSVSCSLALVACGSPDRRETAHSGLDSADIAPRLVALERDIERRRLELNIPGAAVTIVTGDRVLLRKGFGLRDVASQLPVTAHTVFAIGSCAKPFTSLAVGIGTDLGLLSYDRSPRDFLPDFELRDSLANANVTMSDLLSHRTGARQAFQYNNFMYVAAGEALAAAARVPYPAFMTGRVFAPLGMLSTYIRVDDLARAPEVSLGYTGGPGDVTRQPVYPARMRYLDGIAAAGGIFSTAADMSRWMRMMVAEGALDDDRIISDTSYAAMLVPAVRTSGTRHYALGWFVEQWKGHTLYSHAGGVTGFGARCEFAPSLNLGWVVLTNVDDGSLPSAVRDLVYEHLIRTQ